MFPIVFLEHPPFLGSHSMTRFATMLREEFGARGYPVQAWAPSARCHRLAQGTRLAKWAGYVDQYVLFPRELRARLEALPPDALVVLCDQALGPWLPRVAERPHVVHCHDLLALRSALGEFPHHRTGWSGRIYQRWIRAGWRRAKHLISVSRNTQSEMRRLGGFEPLSSDVVYNGLDAAFAPLDRPEAQRRLHVAGLDVPAAGFVLHVGSGSWYKNREGVVRVYAEHVRACVQQGRAVPALWMVGPPPEPDLQALIDGVPEGGSVRFHAGLDNATLAACYARAEVFLFPSFAEGFGWPIAEALACGCPVMTTGEAPMNEVGGDAAVYLPAMPHGDESAWAAAAARTLSEVIGAPPGERADRRERGLATVRRFEARAAIDAYEAIYRRVQATARVGAGSLTAPVRA